MSHLFKTKSFFSTLDIRYWVSCILFSIVVITTLLLTFAGRYTLAGLRIEKNRLTGAGDNTCQVPFAAGRSAPPQSGRHFKQSEQRIAGSKELNAERYTLNAADDWLDDLIEKIWYVESSGRANPPDGDGGQAAGPLQIHKAVVDDVNRYYKMNFSYRDRRDINKAKQIAKLYMQLWMEKHKEEIAVRIFNGGPRGWRKKSTDTYWTKISN